MQARRGLLAVSLCSLIGCASPQQPTVQCPEPVAADSGGPAAPSERTRESTDATLASTQIFLVRHAEKANDGTKDPPLLPEGTVRATCLAQTFADVALTHVFATDLQRTALTVQPLASAKGLEIQTLPASDIEPLAVALRRLPPGSVAVVAGHSNSIPYLAELFGAQLPDLNSKGHIPEAQHDRLIELTVFEGAASGSLTQLRYCAPSSRD